MMFALQNAEEIYTRTIRKIETGTTNELKDIVQKIEEAVSNGQFSFSSPGVLSDVSMRRLTELGYKVKTGSQYNKAYYTVSWNVTQ